MNPYIFLSQTYQKLFNDGKELPLGGFKKLSMPELKHNAPKMLIFSPHPDDECITGLLPLKFRRDKFFNVINVAVTLGSKKERQLPRYEELKNACEYLNFNLIRATETGLENVKLSTRENSPNEWDEKISCIADIIKNNNPEIILLPHENDWNASHIGTHFLVLDALKSIKNFSCKIIETEFWAAMQSPNLMIEATAEELGQLITAISFHVGEVKRNPYHLTLPAWMMDNVRRGAEIVGGQGGNAPDFTFATIYRAGTFENGKITPAFTNGKIISSADIF